MKVQSLGLALIVTVIFVGLAVMRNPPELNEPDPQGASYAGVESDSTPPLENARIATLFNTQTSGEMVHIQGPVQRILRDDNEGSRHQRFIVELEQQTILIAHNIDLAQRVPVAVGDTVEVFGQYEWNELGGVIHWTHADPDGDHVGGWIAFEGERFE